MKSIKFVNGSEITAIESDSKPRNIPMLFYSVDLSGKDSDGYYCISYYCSKCKNIVTSHYFKNKEDVDLILHKECPHCGVRFKSWSQSS